MGATPAFIAALLASTAITMTIGLTLMVRALREIAQMVRENTQMVKEAHEATLKTYRAVKGLE